MNRPRRSEEREDKQGFQLTGTYTNPHWNQIAVVDDCILVDNYLAVPVRATSGPKNKSQKTTWLGISVGSVKKLLVSKDIKNLEENANCLEENAKQGIHNVRPLNI